jgi:hypothetical protein
MIGFSVRSKSSGVIFGNYLSRLGALVVIALFLLAFIPAIAPSLTGSAASPAVVQHPAGTIDPSMTRFGPRNPYSHTLNFGKANQAPGCTGNPCPMGVVDYGITNNLASYSYNAKQVEGRIDVAQLVVAAAASNTPVCIDHFANPGGIAHCFTLQLNWIAQNMYDGRNKPGDYWAQDVVQIGYDQSCTSPCISGRFSVTFLDNVWNFSSASLDLNCGVSGEQGCMESGFHGGVGCTASNPSHDYYGCTGSTIYGVIPPFSIVTKIIVNACGSSGTISCFLFSGQVRQAGADLFNSVFDVFEFTNSLSTTVRPAFHVSGTGHPPFPLPWDGEWVAAGACCGLAYSPGLTGTWQEFYSTSATKSGPGAYVSIKHAWSSGLDTSESVATVEMYGFGGEFDSATSIFNPDNPATNLW